LQLKIGKRYFEALKLNFPERIMHGNVNHFIEIMLC